MNGKIAVTIVATDFGSSGIEPQSIIAPKQTSDSTRTPIKLDGGLDAYEVDFADIMKRGDQTSGTNTFDVPDFLK